MEQNLELKTKTVDYDETADKIVHKYTVGQFEGPLDLLWTLIRDNKINIYDIPIAEITEQFLEYLDYASQVEVGDLSEFYNMAARLVYIKSRMMLPVEVKVDDDLDYGGSTGRTFGAVGNSKAIIDHALYVSPIL